MPRRASRKCYPTGSPRDKAKVEAGVRFAQSYILGRLRHQTFFSLAECNTAIASCLDRMNAHVMRRLGVSRRDLFDSIERSLRAQRFILSSVKGAYFPSLFLGASFTDNGPAIDNLTWNWGAQLQLQWNLFQGLLTKSQVREARANLRSIEAQRDLVRQQVRLEVDQARLALRGAKSALVAAVEALANARIRLNLAERRYQTGVGSAIELGDAQVALTNAAAQEVGARFNIATARAQLLKAIGESG